MKPIFSYRINQTVVRDKVAMTGYSAKQIADKSGLAPLTITRAFSGEDVTASTLKKIADVFGVSPLELAAE